MLVTVVHNDTDNIKYQIKILREGLAHVAPRVDFKSCCVWEFTGKVFDENQVVLAIISKTCESFRKKFLEAFQKYRDQSRKVKCRVCVVFETERPTIEEDFISLIGNKNIAVVEDLFQSVKWFPKVCSFLFTAKGSSKALTCTIPKVENSPKVGEFSDNLLNSLRELDIVVSEDFEETPPRCCVLFKYDETSGHNDSLPYVTKVKRLIERSGGTAIQYEPSYTNACPDETTNDIIYGRNNLVLFFLRILHVMEVVKIKTVLGDHRLKRNTKTGMLCCGCCFSFKSSIPTSPESNATGIVNEVLSFNVRKIKEIGVEVSGDRINCDIVGCCFMSRGELVLCDFIITKSNC